MKIRNLDENHDWTFGIGRNNYVMGNTGIALNIKTRLYSFLGNCFFAPEEGLDWWNLLERGQQENAELAIQRVIAYTPGVVNVNNVTVAKGAERNYKMTYNIDTIYSINYTGELNLIYVTI